MKYDLLVQGGEVIDPSAGLSGVMDVGVAGGKIVEVGANLLASEARQTLSAKGRLVTPGLVDIHAHVFVNAHDMGGHTDHFCQRSGVTTLCDAGSTGSAGFAGLRQVLDQSVRTRVRAFVNLSAIGIIVASAIVSGNEPRIERRVVEAFVSMLAHFQPMHRRGASSVERAVDHHIGDRPGDFRTLGDHQQHFRVVGNGGPRFK